MTETIPKFCITQREAPLNQDALVFAVEESVLLDMYAADVNTTPGFAEDIFYRAETVYERDAELAGMLVEKNVEGLHGTRSGSLLMLAKYGLLPVSQQKFLPHPVITGEYWTQPKPREASHVVHWVFAESTRQYAENAESTFRELSIHNYRDALSVPDAYIHTLDAANPGRIYREVRKRKAQEFEQWLQSGKANPLELELHERNFPVVLGLSLNGIDPCDISGARAADGTVSSVQGDCLISTAIPSQNIKLLFVPESQIDFTQKEIAVAQETQILPLERLRAATDGM